ncbi:MAG: membrane protein-like protein, partial [uncultured bacterium]
MPLSDFWIVVRWWGTLLLFGAAAYPLTRRLFSSWFDEGYLFGKAVGIALVSWVVYVLGTLKIAPFTNVTTLISLGALFLLSFRFHGKASKKNRLILFEEFFFFFALLFWTWVKAHEPSIRGLEKFMDFGFMQSILN